MTKGNTLSPNDFLSFSTDRPEQFGNSARRLGASSRSVFNIHDCCERRRQQRRKPKCEGYITGFTLIELIIVIAITGIIIAGSSSLLLNGVNAYMAGKADINASWQANVAIERITRDLRAISSVANIITAASNEFAIRDINGTTIDYKVVNSQLLRNTQVLANNVQSVAFTYYDANGTVTASVSAIRYVGVSLNIIYEKVTTNFSTMVALWNLT